MSYWPYWPQVARDDVSDRNGGVPHDVFSFHSTLVNKSLVETNYSVLLIRENAHDVSRKKVIPYGKT